MDKASFIAFDIESGGVSSKTSLLTVDFIILDDQLNILDELALKLKANDNEPYVIEPNGLEINKINIIEHDKTAITYGEGGQLLVKLLKRYSLPKTKLVPLGHNVAFDIRGITTHLLGDKTWNQWVSYKIQDTQIVARFLQIKGLLPKDMSISLSSLQKHFNIVGLQGVAHESRYDTIATIEVYKRLLNL